MTFSDLPIEQQSLFVEFLAEYSVLKSTPDRCYGPEDESSPFGYRFRVVLYPIGTLTGPCWEVGPLFNSSVVCEQYVQALERYVAERGIALTPWINPVRKKYPPQ